IQMYEAAVVADGGDQVRALRRTQQIKCDRLFDAGTHHTPGGRLPAVNVAEIERLPSAVTGGEHRMVGVEWIDFDVEHPVNRRVGHIRSEGRVKGSATAQNRLPRPTAIRRAINVVVITFAADVSIKRAGDQHLRITSIDGNGGPSEAFGVGLFGRDVGPLAGLGIELPYCAVRHTPWTGHGSVCDVQIAIGSQRGTVRTILRRFVRNWRPGVSCVGASEKIIATEQRNAGVNRRTRLRLRSAAGIEDHEHDSCTAGLSGHPGILAGLGRSWRLGDIGKADHAIPGCAGVGALPQTVVAGPEIKNVAVVGIDGEALAIAAPSLVASKFKWHVGALERATTIARAKDGAIWRMRVGVS